MSLHGDELLAHLPHRPPFLFLTRLARLEAEAGEAGWTVDGNEWFLRGHFPNQPIVPGVLFVEALAQLAGVVAGRATFQSPPESPGPQGALAMVDVRFHETVTPPVEITLKVQLQRRLGRLWLFHVAATAGAKRLASGSLAVALDVAAAESDPVRRSQ